VVHVPSLALYADPAVLVAAKAVAVAMLLMRMACAWCAVRPSLAVVCAVLMDADSAALPRTRS